MTGPQIIVGLDDSYAAHEALRWAANYAHSVDGTVRVVRVPPGGAADALARASRRADLVVVGSVEHECSEQASCPVVVYRGARTRSRPTRGEEGRSWHVRSR